MNVTLHFPDEIASTLQRRAAELGQDVETFIHKVVMEELALEDAYPAPPARSHAEFMAALHAIVTRHPGSQGAVDDRPFVNQTHRLSLPLRSHFPFPADERDGIGERKSVSRYSTVPVGGFRAKPPGVPFERTPTGGDGDLEFQIGESSVTQSKPGHLPAFRCRSATTASYSARACPRFAMMVLQ